MPMLTQGYLFYLFPRLLPSGVASSWQPSLEMFTEGYTALFWVLAVAPSSLPFGHRYKLHCYQPQATTLSLAVPLY